MQNGVSIHVFSCCAGLATKDTLMQSFATVLQYKLPGSTYFLHAGEDIIVMNQVIDTIQLMSKSDALFDGSAIARLNFYNRMMANIPGNFSITQIKGQEFSGNFTLSNDVYSENLLHSENLESLWGNALHKINRLTATLEVSKKISQTIITDSREEFLYKFCFYNHRHMSSDQYINVAQDAISTLHKKDVMRILAKLYLNEYTKLVHNILESFPNYSIDLTHDDLYKDVLKSSPQFFKLLLEKEKATQDLYYLDDAFGRLNIYLSLECENKAIEAGEIINSIRLYTFKNASEAGTPEPLKKAKQLEIKGHETTYLPIAEKACAQYFDIKTPVIEQQDTFLNPLEY